MKYHGTNETKWFQIHKANAWQHFSAQGTCVLRLQQVSFMRESHSPGIASLEQHTTRSSLNNTSRWCCGNKNKRLCAWNHPMKLACVNQSCERSKDRAAKICTRESNLSPRTNNGNNINRWSDEPRFRRQRASHRAFYENL